MKEERVDRDTIYTAVNMEREVCYSRPQIHAVDRTRPYLPKGTVVKVFKLTHPEHTIVKKSDGTGVKETRSFAYVRVATGKESHNPENKPVWVRIEPEGADKHQWHLCESDGTPLPKPEKPEQKEAEPEHKEPEPRPLSDLRKLRQAALEKRLTFDKPIAKQEPMASSPAASGAASANRASDEAVIGKEDADSLQRQYGTTRTSPDASGAASIESVKSVKEGAGSPSVKSENDSWENDTDLSMFY